MKAKIKLVEGMQFVANADSRHAVIMDASENVGGKDSGARPMELLLLGLGGCTGMDVISILRKMKQDIKGFEIEIEADRAKTYPKVYIKVHIIYKIWGDISEDKLKKAIELSQETYCSASAMFKKTAEVTYEYKILKE